MSWPHISGQGLKPPGSTCPWHWLPRSLFINCSPRHRTQRQQTSGARGLCDERVTHPTGSPPGNPRLVSAYKADPAIYTADSCPLPLQVTADTLSLQLINMRSARSQINRVTGGTADRSDLLGQGTHNRVMALPTCLSDPALLPPPELIPLPSSLSRQVLKHGHPSPRQLPSRYM